MGRYLQKVCVPPASIHSMRHAKNKVLGQSIEAIAKEEGVGEQTVRMSIARVEAYHAIYTVDELKTGEIEVVLFNHEVKKMALHEALTAENKIYSVGGELVDKVPDHDTRLRAVEILAKVANNIMGTAIKFLPNPSSSQVNVNVLAGGGSAGIVIATFEDRLREVQKKRLERGQNNALPASTEAIDVEEVHPNWEDDDEGSS